jgi:hypothetical protein
MQSPVLVIDGKPVLIGFTSDIEKIKKLISGSNNINNTELENKPKCTCGGKY